MSKRDDNRNVVGLVYNGTTVVPLKVDPITGWLLIEIDSVKVGSPTVHEDTPRDSNRVGVSLATNGSKAIPLHIDSESGNLSIDLLYI